MNDINELVVQVEALLFSFGGSMSRPALAKAMGASVQDIEKALEILQEREGGIVLVDDGREVELRAAPSTEALIENIRKETYTREVGRAGLEVLAALLYRGALSRSDIDFIRGVNSSQTIRTLAARGLIRKVANPKDERSFLYEPTTELFAALGLAHHSDLPEYRDVRKKLEELEHAYRGNNASDV